MSKIRVDLESVQVTEGEGIGEGDFELRIQVQEGTNHMVWPSLNSSARIDKGGAAYTINREIGTYSVSSGTLSKKFDIDVTEVDKGKMKRSRRSCAQQRVVQRTSRFIPTCNCRSHE
jgi:hypothetical protein